MIDFFGIAYAEGKVILEVTVALVLVGESIIRSPVGEAVDRFFDEHEA